MASEKSIQNASLIAVTAIDRTMAWRNNTGAGWVGQKLALGFGMTVTIRPGMVVLADARPIRFGLVGSPDVLGVTAGRAWGQEFKTLTGRQREEQVRFQRAFEAAGGTYQIVRSVEDAVAMPMRLLRGE